MQNTLRVKIEVPEGNSRPIERSSYKALKKYDDYDSPVLRVLGVPFWGPHEKRDSEGEAFHPETDIAMRVGDTVPVTYYHGFGPDSPNDWQEKPVWLGVAKYDGVDEQGHWFEVKLDESEPLAMRVLNEPTKARASSGAVSHLVRSSAGGLIDVWPVGELAVFETNEWKQPANDYAVIELKAAEVIEPKTEAKTEQVSDVAPEPEAVIEIKTIEIETIQETIKMSDEMKNEVPEVVEPKVDVKAELDAFKAEVKGMLDEVITAKSAPVIGKQVTGKLDKDAETDEFLYWCKTGNKTLASAKALVEGTDASGGYLVPEDFLGRIVAKRDEQSIMRQMGAQVIQTSHKVLAVPIENTAAVPAITTEGGAYNNSEPTFNEVSITQYKMTDLVKISEELEEDEGANMSNFLVQHVARQFGLLENQYFFVGTGSAQPQGVFVGGTAAVTLDSLATIGSSELPEIYFKLAGEYRESPSCGWAMNDATAGLIYGLTGDAFQFAVTPQGDKMNLIGKPMKSSAKIATMAANAKAIVFGDFSYYMIAERRGLRVIRNPYLYQANGHVGLFWSQRVGGAVLQAEAFQYATCPAS